MHKKKKKGLQQSKPAEIIIDVMNRMLRDSPKLGPHRVICVLI